MGWLRLYSVSLKNLSSQKNGGQISSPPTHLKVIYFLGLLTTTATTAAV